MKVSNWTLLGTVAITLCQPFALTMAHRHDIASLLRASRPVAWCIPTIERSILRIGRQSSTCPPQTGAGGLSQRPRFRQGIQARPFVASANPPNAGQDRPAQGGKKLRMSLKGLSAEVHRVYSMHHRILDAIDSGIIPKARILTRALSLLNTCLHMKDLRTASTIASELVTIIDKLHGRTDIDALVTATEIHCMGGQLKDALSNVRILISKDKWPSRYMCHELLRTSVTIDADYMSRRHDPDEGFPQVLGVLDKKHATADPVAAIARIDETLEMKGWERRENILKFMEACGHELDQQTYEILLK
jgi:hypothetical protein